MMYGSEWTLKYDETEVENVSLGLRPCATFSAEGHHFTHTRLTALSPGLPR